MNKVKTDDTQVIEKAKVKPYGDFYGILILVVTGVAIAPVRLIVKAYVHILPLFKEENFIKLTLPESPTYHPLWSYWLGTELAMTAILTILAIIFAIVFIKKKRLIHGMATTFLGINLAYVLGDFAMTGVIPNSTQVGNASTVMDVIKASAALAVWILYARIVKKNRETIAR